MGGLNHQEYDRLIGFKYFLFSPRTLGKWSILTNIVQMGWFNHQLAGCLGLEAFPLISLRKNPPSPVGNAPQWWRPAASELLSLELGKRNRRDGEMAVHNELGKWRCFGCRGTAVWNPRKWIQHGLFLVGNYPKFLEVLPPKKPKFQAEKDKSDLNFGLCFLTFVPKVDVLNKQIGPRWKLPVHCDIVDWLHLKILQVFSGHIKRMALKLMGWLFCTSGVSWTWGMGKFTISWQTSNDGTGTTLFELYIFWWRIRNQKTTNERGGKCQFQWF